jgi:hypothetical protein
MMPGAASSVVVWPPSCSIKGPFPRPIARILREMLDAVPFEGDSCRRIVIVLRYLPFDMITRLDATYLSTAFSPVSSTTSRSDGKSARLRTELRRFLG